VPAELFKKAALDGTEVLDPLPVRNPLVSS
jgi:hypothetical protein